MTAKTIRREKMATALGVVQWEDACGFNSPKDAAIKLRIPLRTYHRYKAEGLPRKLQREVLLDRMESALSKKRG